MALDLTIVRLGAQGDGVAETSDGQLFVSFALPGERVRVEPAGDGRHARLLEVLKQSPERVEPICPHFGVCGGCALQHMKPEAYLAWKRDLVTGALKSRGLDANVEEVRAEPLASRRRATFGLGTDRDGIALGFHRARSHDLIDIETCPILSPRIAARLSGLKAMLAPLSRGRQQLRVGITETESGLDVVVEGAQPKETELARLGREAGALGVARITIGELSVTLLTPTVRFGRALVSIPPGAFLQASPTAESVLTAIVRDGIGKAKRIADLFAGLGTFSLALGEVAAVDAYEANETALAALAEAARHTPKLKPIRTYPRDLLRDPLGHQELATYDAVVFDPSRAGAAAQAEQLAHSKVKRLIAVSCNPGTLARDLRVLVDGGYRLTRVVPIDQFLFSGHIEVVAHLSR